MPYSATIEKSCLCQLIAMPIPLWCSPWGEYVDIFAGIMFCATIAQGRRGGACGQRSLSRRGSKGRSPARRGKHIMFEI